MKIYCDTSCNCLHVENAPTSVLVDLGSSPKEGTFFYNISHFAKSVPVYNSTRSSQHPSELASSLFPLGLCGWRQGGLAGLSCFTKVMQTVVAGLELQSRAVTCRSGVIIYVWGSVELGKIRNRGLRL